MDTASMNEWWSFWDKNKISYLNWALSNKGEGSAALNPNTVASDVGNPSHWSASGKFVQAHLKNMNNGWYRFIHEAIPTPSVLTSDSHIAHNRTMIGCI